MSSVIGNITFIDDRSVKWEICPPLRQGYKHLYGSECFTLANGKCRLVIEKDNFIYKLKLAIFQNSTFQSLLLSIQKRHEVLQSQLFHNNENPLMQIANSYLMTSDDGTPISIHCVVQLDTVGAEESPNKGRAVDGKKIVTPKDKGGAEESQNKGSAVDGKKIVTPKDKGTTKLIKDLEEILRSGKDSDAVLNVQGKEFKVHRLIVGMRSPVFSAMFENEMEEKNSGVVNIEDCDPEIFPDFLHYIYTGSVEDLTSKNAFQLYSAADKYQLQELKEECLEYMKCNVSVENFCDVMSLSLLHQEEELTRIATQFFLENAADVVPSAKWMTFLTKNVIAGNELMVKLTQCVAKRNK